MEQPRVTIIVPAYQAEETIEKCIESLLLQDYAGHKLEIIVVDNNSSDNTAQLVKKYPVKYLLEERQGACFARNKGLQNATGELIAFTDSDCFAEKDWISRLVVPFLKDEKIGGVGGHLAPYPTDNIVERYITYREILTQEIMFREKENSPPFFITANVMYRADILREIGGFDNFFSINGEDADLSWRVVEAGYTLILEPEAIVLHKHRANVEKLFKQLFSYGVGTVALFKKYRKTLGKSYWIHTLAYKNMLRGFCRAPFYVVSRKDELERFVPLLDGINNLGFVLGKMYGSVKYKVLVL